jgi:uncharacterized protein (UPF0248 family)
VKPIQELFSRIRWDKEFAKGRFEISFYDRIKNEIDSVQLEAVQFMEGDRYFAFQFVDKDGEGHSVPFHRIREIRKDGKPIWQRRLDTHTA